MSHEAGASGRPRRDYEIIIVTYRSRPLVEKLLADLDRSVPVAIVDNAHGEDGLDEVAAGRPSTRYLDGPGRGYAAGANLGASTSTHHKVVFVNPDAVPTVAQLDELTAELDHDPQLAISCALKVESDGRAEIGVGGWEPNVPRAVVHALGLHKLFPLAGLWARPVAHRPIDVDWLGGACTAVRLETFRALGGFDESYFVYSEDVEFGRAVRAAGLRMRIRTDLLVPNLASGSGDSRTRMLRYRSDSMMRYLRRHHPRRRVEGVRAALTVGIGARLLVCRVRGRDRLAREHAAYLSGLFAGPPA